MGQLAFFITAMPAARPPASSSGPPSWEPLRLSVALLTHKDGLAVHRGRVLVQGQGVCGQLLGLTAFRLRKTIKRDMRKVLGVGAGVTEWRLPLLF